MLQNSETSQVNSALTEEEQLELEQSKLPSSERDYTQRKNPKIALMPPKAGVVVGTGENKRVIDPEEVYKLAKLHCTYEEIADWFGTTPRIIKYNFVDVIAKGKAETKQRLRKALIDTALSGNATCIIWATKQWLGMADQPLPETTEKEGVEFSVKLITKDGTKVGNANSNTVNAVEEAQTNTVETVENTEGGMNNGLDEVD